MLAYSIIVYASSGLDSNCFLFMVAFACSFEFFCVYLI